MMTKILYGKEKFFPDEKKNGSKKDLPALPPRKVLVFILLMSNQGYAFNRDQLK